MQKLGTSFGSAKIGRCKRRSLLAYQSKQQNLTMSLSTSCQMFSLRKHYRQRNSGTHGVENFLKIATKRDITSNHHNTLDRAKCLPKTSSLAWINIACRDAARKLSKESVYIKNNV